MTRNYAKIVGGHYTMVKETLIPIPRLTGQNMANVRDLITAGAQAIGKVQFLSIPPPLKIIRKKNLQVNSSDDAIFQGMKRQNSKSALQLMDQMLFKARKLNQLLESPKLFSSHETNLILGNTKKENVARFEENERHDTQKFDISDQILQKHNIISFDQMLVQVRKMNSLLETTPALAGTPVNPNLILPLYDSQENNARFEENERQNAALLNILDLALSKVNEIKERLKPNSTNVL